MLCVFVWGMRMLRISDTWKEYSLSKMGPFLTSVLAVVVCRSVENWWYGRKEYRFREAVDIDRSWPRSRPQLCGLFLVGKEWHINMNEFRACKPEQRRKAQERVWELGKKAGLKPYMMNDHALFIRDLIQQVELEELKRELRDKR